MPWTGKSFAAKHNHKLSGVVASKAAEIANHVLESTGNEGEAIATGSKYANKLRARGVVSNKARARMKHPELRGRVSHG